MTQTNWPPALRRSGATASRSWRSPGTISPWAHFGDVLADVRRELMDGRGIVMLQNFPIDRFDREATAIAYIGLGAYLGKTMSQNKQGHVLGHVKDLGGDYADPQTRGYMTRAELFFHADACDYVGLLCLQSSKSGGASRVASSVTVYNRILARRPDLAKVLTEDFYRSRSGEFNPGEAPFFKQPIFSFTDGYFSATGASAAVEKAQKLPGVPKFTDAQKEAIALYRATVEECALDIDFNPGDIQFLNNFVMLHYAPQLRGLAGARAQAPSAAAVAVGSDQPADPAGAAAGPRRPRRAARRRSIGGAARRGGGGGIAGWNSCKPANRQISQPKTAKQKGRRPAPWTTGCYRSIGGCFLAPAHRR